MIGLISIEKNGVKVGELVENYLASSKVKKGEFAEKVGMARNTLTQNLQKNVWKNEQILSVVEAANELTLDKDLFGNLMLFPIAIPAFLEEGKSISNGLVGRTIKTGLKNIFIEVMDKHQFKDNLVVDASLGQGNAARSVWIGVRDNRISKNGFSEGVYVVLLFDSNGQFAYLSVAYAVTDKDPKNLEALAKGPAEKIMEVIKDDPRFKGVQPGAIDLGDTKGTVAEQYEKSIIVSKKYTVTKMDQEVLKEDLSLFLSLFYDFVFEDYFEVIEKSLISSTDVTTKEDFTKKSTKKNKAKSKIDPELHKKFLAAKAAHNDKVGKEAEEFVYQLKRNNLLNSDYAQHVNRIKHVSLEKDGYGYDIQSVEITPDGQLEEEYLEVKGSSMGGKNDFTFYLSERELEVAKDLKDKYKLVLVEYVGYERQRIFAEFSPFPKGEDEKIIDMKPIMYKCKFDQ